ncbi:hypothetical protein Hypma_000419 [Hypsizygus marmoreus]|uniref:Transmembrane protein n=1 Tax=Hypsizygus marmoreus TaxID=39966 RepID=A0A369JFY5_HYPMA|nr:hypothetical protein Hypma_000419 [Hypsizygus marmoreus]
MASIVLDDKTNRLKIGGGTWSGVTIERFFENGAIWPAFAIDDNGDTGTYGTLSISFLGTSISFFGNTPSAKASQNIFVSIDGGIPYSTSYGDPSPPTALQWYQSPLLSDSTHTIDITHLAGTSVDYMVITAGQNTPLSGETLIVDDSDSAIAYEGKWVTNVGRYTSRDNPRQGLPYGNGTHQASTSGSSATFRFAGTAISIYSVFDWSKLGSLIVLYTLDGSTTSKTYAVSSSMDEFTSGLTQRENTLMFSSNSLSPGPHTLKMEVKESSNQIFALDYILYSPSFNTLATKPDLPPVVAPTRGTPSPSTPTPGSPTQSTVSPGVSSGSLTGSNTRPTSTLTGSDTGLNASANTSHSRPVGAIVGGVIGGIALLGFFLAFFLCRKRISKQFSSALAPPVDMSSRRPDPLSIEPFTAMSTNATAGSTAPLPGGFGTFSPVRKPGRPGLTMHSYRSHSRMGSSPPTFSVFTPPMSQHKSSHSLSSSGLGPLPALTPVRREYYQEQDGGNVTNSSTLPPGGLLRSRMQRLQNLVLELNRTIVEEGEGARVAELRGRIAELTREDVADIGGGGGGGAREMEERWQSVATILIPPPYEPRRA